MNHFILRIIERYRFGLSLWIEIEISSVSTIKALTDLKVSFIPVKTTELLLPARPFLKPFEWYRAIFCD